MTDEGKLQILGENVVKLYRDSIRTKAKLLALEEMVKGGILASDISVWGAEISRLETQFLQQLLEDMEKKDPGFAAWIDDRKDGELENL